MNGGAEAKQAGFRSKTVCLHRAEKAVQLAERLFDHGPTDERARPAPADTDKRAFEQTQQKSELERRLTYCRTTLGLGGRQG